MTSPLRGLPQRRTITVLLAALAALLGLGTTGAATQAGTWTTTASTTITGATPALSCAQVAQLDLGALRGASTVIGTATTVAAKDNPQGPWEACDVHGVIAPQIQFELLLPTRTWQGDYLQDGCGAYCGNVGITTAAATGCLPLTDGAFAIASDNEGHYGAAGFDAAFGADPTLRASFGYQSEHLLALAAKAIIAHYYGTPARHAYFDGCSQGGHEALTEAQRYPHDFNGIVAGSPASIMTELNLFFQAWNARANTTADGRPILTTADLGPLHQAVLDRCDAADGTKDDLVSDPLACHFDPGSIACHGSVSTATNFCLTPAQVSAARKLYRGPRDAEGKLLYPGGQAPGSELNWVPWFVPAAPGAPTIDPMIAQSTLRYMVNRNIDGAATYRDVKFTAAEFKRVTTANNGMYDATDPDLSAFRAAGGKLILWAGWGDSAISPIGTVAYYTAVEKAMGGSAATRQFARLFMLPGVAHCGGGQGPSTFDALTAVTDWVTKDQAPDSLLTSMTDSSGKTAATRPVYPYPAIAVDTTGGPTGEASSYTAEPGTQLGALNWLGSFRSGYETVSGWVNGQWITRPGKN